MQGGRTIFWSLHLLLLLMLPSFFSAPLIFGVFADSVTPSVSLVAIPESNTQVFIPRGATALPALRFQLLSKQNNIMLRKVDVKRLLVGGVDDIARARLFINGKYQQSSSFEKTNLMVSFTGLEAKLGPSKPLLMEVRVDLMENSKTDQFFQFQILPEFLVFSVENIGVSGQPVSGPIFQTSPVVSDRVTIQNGDHAVSLPNIAKKDQMIGRFVIKASEHDVEVKRLVIRQSGQLSLAEIKNIRLKAKSKIVSRGNFSVDGKLDFKTRGVFIKKGKEVTFTIFADIANPWKVEKIRLFLAEPYDLHVEDLVSGFGTRVVNAFDLSKAWCVGSASPECPAEGFKKRCNKKEIKEKLRDC